ncbi:hypothetical protein BGX28_008678 [Mortierella sp. GBA30]|nr:hypothetical protein BGX28_008678 [Mortierella sp. GBA30]
MARAKVNPPEKKTENIKLGGKIGHGAQAEVFKAKCGLDEVAVKRFLDSTHKDIKHEIEIIKQLRHRHIVQFYHVEQDMLVMEYVDGGSLADAIAGSGLKTWNVKAQIAKDVSLGLAYLHSLDIIHCDIKRANILLTKYNEAKICDFGLAKRVGEKGRGGTLQWMAPELLQDPPQYSSKSDIYALGMVMWEMASGSKQPYEAHAPYGIVHCIMGGITEECPDSTPKDYADCIQMCWRLAPQKRPAAVTVLPDIEASSHGHIAHELRRTEDRAEKTYYLKALKHYFETSGSPAFMAKIKVGDNHQRDGGKGKKHLEFGQRRRKNHKTMKWFNSTASGKKSAAAMFNTGSMYYYGRGGVKQDYGNAFEWYLAASEAGVAVAMLKISDIYQYGHGVEQDDTEAASWYLKAEKTVEDQGKISNGFVHHSTGIPEHHRRKMEWFSSRVGDGSAAAKFNIAVMYENGRKLVQNYNKAMEWYLKASDAGHAGATFRIGLLYDNGQCVEQDYGKALEWYLKASDAGHAGAMLNIGVLYDNGQCVEQDYGKALEWYLKASDAGHAGAMLNIGVLYDNGQGVEQDYGKALEWYLKASEAGHAGAMLNIGVLYDNGQGVEQNYGKALEWYLKASDGGDADAMLKIGVLYRKGLGIGQDYGKALEWYLKASEAGHAGAMLNIGVLYDNGQGVEQNYGKALEWYLKASDGGDADAMLKIGVLYRKGLGIEQDYGKALEWYLKASDDGETRALLKIGVLYHKGLGVEQDYGKALEWYIKSSDDGDASAMFNIGALYENGLGVEQDYSRALKWYIKAYDAGYP